MLLAGMQLLDNCHTMLVPLVQRVILVSPKKPQFLPQLFYVADCD